MTAFTGISIRGIRQTLPSGYVLGRQSSGAGPAQLIPLDTFTSSIAPYIVSIVNSNINVSGLGITNTNGTLSVEWNAGTVTALGSHLTLSGGTLDGIAQQWTAGSVTALSAGLSIVGTTLTANYQAGKVTAFSTGLSIIGTTLTSNYQAGTLASFGTGLALVGTALTPNYQAGTLSAFGSGLSLAGGTLSVTVQGGVLPLVNGDLPGPSLIADGTGQCIGVPI